MKSEQVEVAFEVRALINLPDGQTLQDFDDSREDWECALQNDIMHSGDTGEFAKYVEKIRVNHYDHTADPDWMEL